MRATVSGLPPALRLAMGLMTVVAFAFVGLTMREGRPNAGEGERIHHYEKLHPLRGYASTLPQGRVNDSETFMIGVRFRCPRV